MRRNLFCLGKYHDQPLATEYKMRCSGSDTSESSHQHTKGRDARPCSKRNGWFCC